MTLFFQSHEIIIRRMRKGVGYHTNFSATFTAYEVDMQPIEVGRPENAIGRIGALYDCYLDPTVPIAEGDQIDCAGKRYSVKTVNRYEGSGLLEHVHAILESIHG